MRTAHRGLNKRALVALHDGMGAGAEVLARRRCKRQRKRQGKTRRRLPTFQTLILDPSKPPE